MTAKKTDDTVWVNAVVTIKEQGEPAITVNTDGTGVANFPNINPADYAGTIVTASGETATFNKTADTGVNARITVVVA